MTGKVLKIVNHEKRSGQSTGKDGKEFTWTIKEISVEKEDGEVVTADTFDTVADGDIVDLEPTSYTSPKTQQTYHGWNAKAQKKNSSGGASQMAVLEAIKMVFQEVKEVKAQNEQILAGIAALMGPPEEETKADDMPPNFLKKDEEPEEPHVEPVPDEPQDLASFMNAS